MAVGEVGLVSGNEADDGLYPVLAASSNGVEALFYPLDNKVNSVDFLIFSRPTRYPVTRPQGRCLI